MAVAATLSSTAVNNLGSLTLYTYSFSSVPKNDGQGGGSFASGLGDRVVSYWANSGYPEGTAGDTGVNVTVSSGTFTMYTKTASVDMKLYVLAQGM